MQTPPARVRTGYSLGAAGKTEGLLLGSLAFAPPVIAAIGVWLTPPGLAALMVSAAAIWSGALLAFLAGVRRGLTFSEAETPRPTEILSMLWLFAVAVTSLWLSPDVWGLAAAILGFVSLAALDWRAALNAEAPRYFAVFRPLQAMVAIGALGVLIAWEALGRT